MRPPETTPGKECKAPEGNLERFLTQYAHVGVVTAGRSYLGALKEKGVLERPQCRWCGSSGCLPCQSPAVRITPRQQGARPSRPHCHLFQDWMTGAADFSFQLSVFSFSLFTKGLITRMRGPWVRHREMAWLCGEKVPWPPALHPEQTCYSVMAFPSSTSWFQGPSFFLPQSFLHLFWFFAFNVNILFQRSHWQLTLELICVFFKYEDQ